MRNFKSHFRLFWYFVVCPCFVIFVAVLFLVLKYYCGSLLSNDTIIICILTFIFGFLTWISTKVITTPQITFRVDDEKKYRQNVSAVPCEVENKHGLPINIKIIARIMDKGFKNPIDSTDEIHSGKESFLLNAGGSFRNSMIVFPSTRIDYFPRLLVKIEVKNIFVISKLYYAWYWKQIGTSKIYVLVLDLIRKKSCRNTDFKKVKNAFKKSNRQNCD